MLIPLLKEKTLIWEHLRTAGKPIVLYGMGNGADKVLEALSRYDIAVSGVFASGGFTRGQSFRGFKVETLGEIESRLGDFIVLLCFASCLPDVLRQIYAVAERHELYSPSLPVCSGQFFDMDFLKVNGDKLARVYNRLADDLSRKTFLNVLEYKISGKTDYLRDCESPREEIYRELVKPRDGGVFVDCGAYNGDTVEEFLRWAVFDYSGIVAIEPDSRSFKKLAMKAGSLGIENIRCVNAGVWEKRERLQFSRTSGRQNGVCAPGDTKRLRESVLCDCVDNILNGERACVIKYDVEGAEREALLGSRKTIEKYRPALLISAYHREEDIFELPLLALSMYDGYRLYLRRPAYIPAWDLTYMLV